MCQTHAYLRLLLLFQLLFLVVALIGGDDATQTRVKILHGWPNVGIFGGITPNSTNCGDRFFIVETWQKLNQQSHYPFR